MLKFLEIVQTTSNIQKMFIPCYLHKMMLRYSVEYILYIIIILLDTVLITALLAPCFLYKKQAICFTSLGNCAMLSLLNNILCIRTVASLLYVQSTQLKRIINE